MTLAIILLVLAVIFFGFGVAIKGLLWLLVIGGALLLLAIASGVHGRIQRR